jgi:flagellar protein FliS
MTPNPYQAYQSTQVHTAGTGELIILLYDGAIRFLSRALLAVQDGRLEQANADLVRGQDIMLELVAGLDFEQGGDLAVNLRDLYLFMYHSLIQANLHKDTGRIEMVIRLLDRIRGAWRTVVQGAGAPDREDGPRLQGGLAA